MRVVKLVLRGSQARATNPVIWAEKMAGSGMAGPAQGGEAEQLRTLTVWSGDSPPSSVVLPRDLRCMRIDRGQICRNFRRARRYQSIVPRPFASRKALAWLNGFDPKKPE